MNNKAWQSAKPVKQNKQHNHPHHVTRRGQLEYLSDMLPQMRKMALGIEEPTLAYLLEMAMMEAQLQLELQISVEEEAGA